MIVFVSSLEGDAHEVGPWHFRTFLLLLTLSAPLFITLAEAKENFYKFKAAEYQRKDKTLTKEEAKEKAKQHKTIPERYYREKMSETQGLLMIYLFDSTFAFNQNFTSGKLKKIIFFNNKA